MTDQDRGAYTPQTDAPLAFDARYSRSSGGRPLPMTLILSGVVLIVLIAALAVFYRSGVRGSGQAPQVVGTPVGATKAPPWDSSAPPADSDAGLQVYKAEATPAGEGRSTATSATLAPPPETPAPRPVASPDQANLRPALPQVAQTVAAAPTAPPVAAPVAPPAAAPVAAKPKLAKVAAATPAADKAAPAKVATAVLQSKADMSEIPTGAPVVQIGAFSSSALAEKGWSDVAVLVPGQMSGKTRKVEMASRDGKTFYRTFVGGFASKTAAESFCASLKAAGKGCMVK